MNESNLKSAFANEYDYNVKLNSSGEITITDSNNQKVELKSPATVPSFKKISNVRTLTIIEAEGSYCIYIPGHGWCCC